MTWLDELGALRGDRALDVATGTGRFAAMLAGRYREVVGVDWPQALDGAVSHPGVRYQAMDAEALAFPDASFDLVALSWALHALANPTGVLHEMRRVLKPGGVFLLVEPIMAPQGTIQDAALEGHALLGRLAGVPPLFQRLQVGSIIQGLGLTEIAFHPLLSLPAEASWDVAACRAHARPMIEKLERVVADQAVAAWDREAARAIAERLREHGSRTPPMMLTYGLRPAWVGAS